MLLLGLLAAGLAISSVATAPATAATVDPANDRPRLPASCLDGSYLPTRPVLCRLNGRHPRRPTVLIWGDSHAFQWIPAIRTAARGSGYNLVASLMGHCPPMYPRIRSQREYDRVRPCLQSNYLAAQFVQKLQSEGRALRVILGGSWQRYRAAIEGLPYYHYGSEQLYLEKNADSFADYGPRLFALLGRKRIGTDVVGQSPVVPDPQYQSRAEECGTPYTCPIPRYRAMPQAGSTRAWLRDLMGPLATPAQLINVADEICFPKICPGIRRGVYTFVDNVHISATRAGMTSGVFARSLSRVE